mgnify:CR=1 FL=1
MRVISGSRKGHRLKAPKGLDTRPTQDRIKESLFNILGSIEKDSSVLDLFSGSGSIGIEFLSRGSEECYFIDNSFNSIKAIKENLNSTKLNENAKVYKNDVLKAMEILGRKGLNFHYIFMDPPYRSNLIVNVLESICKNHLLKDKGIIIIEHENTLILNECIYNLHKIDERRYGDKTITFMNR